jgi:hypothetical protein
MSRHHPLYAWSNEVATHFPHLSKPQATVLALWSFGIVLARSCTLSAVANILNPVLGRCFNTVRQRLREWYKAAPQKAGTHRCELDVTSCFGPLLTWIFKHWTQPRVALALDATSLADRLVVLSVSVVYRGTSIPVAWKVLRGNQPHAWKPEWLTLLQWLGQRIDPAWLVVVMTDRGLYAKWLFQAIVAQGWHPLMRVTRLGKFRPEGWTKPQPFWRFASGVGRSWQGRGVAFPRKPERRLECTLLACWTDGHEDGWYVLTDLPPQAADVAWYGLRMWIEHGFEQFKSTGWQWQKTRITAIDREDRMWLALALATFWTVAIGGEHDHAEGAQETIPECPNTDPRRHGPETPGAKRKVSVLAQGIALILAMLIEGKIPLPGRWYPEPWPGVTIIGKNQSHDQYPKPPPKNLPQ